MSLTLLLFAAASAACPEVTFTFSGQPDCVDLVYEGGRTQLTNACDAPLLVDQSVQLPDASAPRGVIPARTASAIRDLSALAPCEASAPPAPL